MGVDGTPQEQALNGVAESEQELVAPESVKYGEVKVATFGCAPKCNAVGTSTEGWYDGCSGVLISGVACSEQAAYCDAIGTAKEGWYAAKGALIAKAKCSKHSTKNFTRAFVFQGKQGQSIDLYVDGLMERGYPNHLHGLDTKVKLYRGSQLIASNDETASKGWTLRSNLAPNAHSSSINSFVLYKDAQYKFVVTVQDDRQGSVEVVVKTPQLDYCATFWDVDAVTNTTFFGAKNFQSEEEGQAWLDQVAPNAPDHQVKVGRCNDPVACAEIHKPVCAFTGDGPNFDFANECEFRAKVLKDAGDQPLSESKGKFVPGQCQKWCATTSLKPADSNNTYFYAKNFHDEVEAQQWLANFGEVISSNVWVGPCDALKKCTTKADPICGQVLDGVPQTFPEECAFRAAILVSAGNDDPSESKGFFRTGSCN
jgi:hypothetical protein